MNSTVVAIMRTVGRRLYGRRILRFYPARVAFKFLEPRLKSNVAEVQGHRMFLDAKDSLDLSIFGFYRKHETELIRKTVKKGDVVLDIGAHIGYFTLLLARLVGENGRVYAFEPDPTNSALLGKNVKTNGYTNVILEQKAVSNKSGKVPLYLSQDHKAGHTTFNTHSGRHCIDIEAVRLDDYFKDSNENIDFIKIVINGAEGHALQGMSSILQKNKNVKLLTQFIPEGLRGAGIEPQQYLKELMERGFKLYYIDERVQETKLVSIDDLMRICLTEQWVALLCLK